MYNRNPPILDSPFARWRDCKCQTEAVICISESDAVNKRLQQRKDDRHSITRMHNRISRFLTGWFKPTRTSLSPRCSLQVKLSMFHEILCRFLLDLHRCYIFSLDFLDNFHKTSRNYVYHWCSWSVSLDHCSICHVNGCWWLCPLRKQTHIWSVWSIVDEVL